MWRTRMLTECAARNRRVSKDPPSRMACTGYGLSCCEKSPQNTRERDAPAPGHSKVQGGAEAERPPSNSLDCVI